MTWHLTCGVQCATLDKTTLKTIEEVLLYTELNSSRVHIQLYSRGTKATLSYIVGEQKRTFLSTKQTKLSRSNEPSRFAERVSCRPCCFWASHSTMAVLLFGFIWAGPRGLKQLGIASKVCAVQLGNDAKGSGAVHANSNGWHTPRAMLIWQNTASDPLSFC